MRLEIRDLMKRPPIFVHTMGTAANMQARYCYQEMVQTAGDVLKMLRIYSVDGAGQVPRRDLSMLPDEFFFNAAADPQILERLRRSKRDLRMQKWFPEMARRLAIGDGAGAIPAIARYLLEQSRHSFVNRATNLLHDFQSSNRAKLAESCRESEWLRRQRIELTADGPIEGYVVAAINGGMVAGLPYSFALLRWVFSKLAIPAKWKLILTPTASDCGETPDDKTKKSLAYARLQELMDYQTGRTLEWAIDDDFVIRDKGPWFDAIYLMPEPRLNALDEHHRFVGHFIFSLITGLGKTINDKTVDMLRRFHQRGPHGTPKLLSLVNASILNAAAYDNVGEFALAELGARATAAGNGSNDQAEVLASEMVQSLGLTANHFDAERPNVGVSQPPTELPPRKFDAYLEGATRQAFGKASRAAHASLVRLKNSLDSASHNLPALFAKQLETYGPMFAAQVSQAVSQRIHRLLAYVEAARVPSSKAEVAAGNDERLRIAVEKTTARVYQEVLLKQLQPHVDEIAVLCAKLDKSIQQIATDFVAMSTEFANQRRAFRVPACFAILDRASLAKRIELVADQCTAEVWKGAAQAIESDDRVSKIREDLRTIVDKYSATFCKLDSINNAFDVAGIDGERAFSNALCGAEPNCRVDPEWDIEAETSRHIFVTMPEDHPQAATIQKTSRQLNFAPASNTRQVEIVSITYGVEICALDGAKEAHRAYLEVDDDLPVYADKEFEPARDLIAPRSSEVIGNLVLAIHLVLKSGTICYDKTRSRYYWKQIELGSTRSNVLDAILAEGNRIHGLPSRQQLEAEVERLLFDGRTREQVILVLREIEQRLTRHLRGRPSHAIKQCLYLERASARSLIMFLEAKEHDDETEMENWIDEDSTEIESCQHVVLGAGNNGHK